jgi:PAS domain S-box-containing protein
MHGAMGKEANSDAEKTLVELNQLLQETNARITAVNQELYASIIRYHELFNNTGTALCTLNEAGIITACNARFEQLSGYSKLELEGKKAWTDFAPMLPSMIAQGSVTVDAGKSGDGQADLEMQFRTGTGVLRYIQVFSGFMKLTGEHIVSIIDISDKKKAEEELVKARKRAEESDRLKSSFLANMSHEIRTPMNAILGFASLLKNENYSKERRDAFIEIINTNSKQLLQIITDIIDISKIESGQISIFNRDFPLNELIEQLAFYYSTLIAQEKKNLVLKYSFGFKAGNDWIFGDRVRIEQILTNLLSNAFKFTSSGEIEIGYDVVKESGLVFFVRDTGIGMTPQEQQVIFDRFRQASSSINRKYGGTGLGLTISRGLAEAMGGSIHLESAKDRGSAFYLQLPYVKGKQKIPETRHVVTDYNWSDKTIVIAEDEDYSFEFIETLLKPTGIIILRAKSGDEAVSLCQSTENISMVLMDVKLPGMDGLEATRQIRKFNRNLPVVAQTAYAMSLDEDSCIKAGCNAYLAKPTSGVKLLKIIEDFIGTRDKGQGTRDKGLGTRD